MAKAQPAIKSERLARTLDAINCFGRNAQTGGFDRIGYSDADMAARRWLADTMAGHGLRVHTDAVGNVFGRIGPAEGPSILVGSHLDTVPDGGAFDGALGVAVALECVLAIKDAGVEPQTAIEVVATAEEEGRFGGMLGSQAIAGLVDPGWLAGATDNDGIRLTDAMRAQGLDPARVGEASRPKGSVRAFIELHIEQGPVLEKAEMPIGIASAVSGVSNLEITLEGQANHSGTTPMDMRADAFAGLADAAARIPDLIARHGTDQSRVTIGKVTLSPNHAHTVAGQAVFSVVIRDTAEAVMRRLTDEFRSVVDEAAARNGLGVAVEPKSWLAPVRLDAGLRALLTDEASALGLPALEMPSGAGHDAQTMQALCPSALIFVPSRNGISHAPQEWTDHDDIEKGARLMLAALMRLAG